MMAQHFQKYFQKYHLILYSAIILIIFNACSSTKKVPKDSFLLVKNKFTYVDPKFHNSDIPNYVSQKPNKKTLLLPIGLWIYDMASPKYDSLLTEYATYPSEIRNQDLRDSLFIKYKMPNEVGSNLFLNRLAHSIGQGPVLLDESKSLTSKNNIRKYLVYKGYWDADVQYKNTLDTANQKAVVNYTINQKTPSIISEYYYNIKDPVVKEIFEYNRKKSIVLTGDILDQSKLEREIDRISTLMKNEGYYRFNFTKQDIFFTADTLLSRKKVPLVLEIKKNSKDSTFFKTQIGKVKLFVLDKIADSSTTKKEVLREIEFRKLNNNYSTNALWRTIILKPGEIYNQNNLDLTKRNIGQLNNFSFLHYEENIRPNTENILDINYFISPLPKYEFRVATDVNYSQLLNFGITPSVDLTTRNVFGGAENLVMSVSGTFGQINNSRDADKKSLAYELSAQANLTFPRLLLPFKTYKFIPKRYSPSTNITAGISMQNNIGLGRINFNAGLNYLFDVNEVISHKISLFNTQVSLTQNKSLYYDFFPNDALFRNEIFKAYSPTLYDQFASGHISSDEATIQVLSDDAFVNKITTENPNMFYNFIQSIVNKNRQTQDVVISSVIYNFTYNELGKKNKRNPFYFNAKIETAGNLLNLFAKKTKEQDITNQTDQRTIFGTAFSQFVKLDLDIRKYFQFFNDKQTLILRQFIGIGKPYGNSTTMPFVRSYLNGGSNDIRAWRMFEGLGPADSQLDSRIRAYVMDNIKLTTNIEYRIPLNNTYETAFFVDAGNIWSTSDSGFGDQFKFNKFIKQMGVGAGIGFRMNISYITLRLDAAYKVHDPNKPEGERWVINKWQPLKPVLNFAFGYPF